MTAEIDTFGPSHLTRLSGVLDTFDAVTIAVSGGVDSLTLARFCQDHLGPEKTHMVHAVSPAVPAAATARVKELAAADNWRLSIVDAGEYGDERYRQNPINRCYFCKSNLYETLAGFTEGVTVSGTNTDDLGDYRPGLIAADENTVRHPYVEAGFSKSNVRALARHLGMPDIAELPASPCLASRVETGLRIEKRDLLLIDKVEAWLASEITARSLRCRKRASGFVIELDAQAFDALTADRRDMLTAEARTRFDELKDKSLSFEPYRMGSAFLKDRNPAMVSG